MDGVTWEAYEENLEADLSGSPATAAQRSVSGEARADDIHPEGRRAAAAARHREPGGLILIVFALVLAAASASATFTGVVVLVFAALGAYLFISLAFASLGGRALPLGPVVMK